MNLFPNIAFVLMLVFANEVAGQESRRGNTEQETICPEIANYFSPPTAYKEVYGNYRSPLKFYNGDSVRTAQNWQLRRKEIQAKWHSLMGKWPAFITNQQMEVLET